MTQTLPVSVYHFFELRCTRARRPTVLKEQPPRSRWRVRVVLTTSNKSGLTHLWDLISLRKASAFGQSHMQTTFRSLLESRLLLVTTRLGSLDRAEELSFLLVLERLVSSRPSRYLTSGCRCLLPVRRGAFPSQVEESHNCKQNGVRRVREQTRTHERDLSNHR